MSDLLAWKDCPLCEGTGGLPVEKPAGWFLVAGIKQCPTCAAHFSEVARLKVENTRLKAKIKSLRNVLGPTVPKSLPVGPDAEWEALNILNDVYCRQCGEVIRPGEFNEVAGLCIHCAPCRCEEEEER